MSFSENLKKTMEEQGITQYKMAKETKISQGLISAWISGKKEPGIKHLKTIAEYLKKSADTLLDIDTDMIQGGVIIKGLLTCSRRYAILKTRENQRSGYPRFSNN